MMVAAEPMSIAIESETKFRKARIPMNAAVLLMNDIQLAIKALMQLKLRELSASITRPNSLRQSIVQCRSILCDEGTRESSVEALSVGRSLSWPLCSMKRMKTVTVGPGWPLKS